MTQSGIGYLALAAALSFFPPAAQSYELVIPALEYRTGPYAANGIPFWNGFADYLTMLNARDGGIDGVKIKIVRCETAYDVKRGLECYAKVKSEPPSGALVINTVSTGITYELIPKAAIDKVPVLSAGYGRASAANGRVFEWVFNFPATYWTAASIMVKYIAERGARLRQIKDQENRTGLSGQPLRQGADPDTDRAGKKARVRVSELSGERAWP